MAVPEVCCARDLDRIHCLRWNRRTGATSFHGRRWARCNNTQPGLSLRNPDLAHVHSI
jgi:hypothetical protein